MNKNILNTNIQEFIDENITANVSSLLLKGINLEGVSDKEIVEQIEAKNRAKTKLPTWYNATQIYYPNKLNIEQTSSELTAQYKANLIKGNSIVDITGGFGIDSYFFSKTFKEVYHCEINTELSEIATHNFQVLQRKNISTIAEDGISFLERTSNTFDCIYVDPSRRNNIKNKVFLLQDCTPNMALVLPLLFKKTSTILVKTSPLLDISIGIETLKKVSEIHIVAIQNEVKELLWILKDIAIHSPKIKTINFSKNEKEQFDFQLIDESIAEATLSKPLKYLYEPNAAILKSGAFNSLSEMLQLKKLQKHTHLYTSENLIDFPGRTFEILKILPYNKKILTKELPNNKANITTRNFPETVAQIRKKTKITDGGDIFLFFCTDFENNKIILYCKKK